MDSFWDFFWFIISFFLLMAYLVVLFQVIGDLFRDRSTSGGKKAVWVFFLIFFPVLTSLIYLVVRGPSMAERAAASAAAAEQHAEAYLRSLVTGAVSPADEIARAKQLLDSGAIDQDEYAALKSKALSPA